MTHTYDQTYLTRLSGKLSDLEVDEFLMVRVKLQNLLLPLGILAIAAIAFFAYSAAAAPLPFGFPPPTPEGKIEIKQYPAYRCATVRHSGELSMAANSAFNPLYRHISSNDISMTARRGNPLSS